MLLSGLGLTALLLALVAGPAAHTQGPFMGAASEPLFLEDGRNYGQGKGYLSTEPFFAPSDNLVLSELVGASPHALRNFPQFEQAGELIEFIMRKSQEYGVSPLLVLSLIDVESGFRPGVVSRRGAVGLMQLLPTTAEEVATSTGMAWHPSLLRDPKANIELGLRYMKMLKKQFRTDAKTLTAYNIGPAALAEKLAQGEPYSLDYFRRVKSRMRDYGRNARIPRSHARLWAKAWL